MRTSKPVTVDLGDLQDRVDARVRAGSYASVGEVLRAGVRALDREDEARDATLRAKVLEALDDDQPGIPAEDVFAQLRDHHAERMKTPK